MGGELMVSSSGVPGEGCVFQFDIPFVPVTANGMVASLPPSADSAHVTGKKREMVFDLTGVSPRWVKRVQQAGAEADTLKLSRLAAEVKEIQPALAQALQEWIHEYNYGAILAAVQVTAVDG